MIVTCLLACALLLVTVVASLGLPSHSTQNSLVAAELASGAWISLQHLQSQQQPASTAASVAGVASVGSIGQQQQAAERRQIMSGDASKLLAFVNANSCVCRYDQTQVDELPNVAEWLVMIYMCDALPMFHIFESFLPRGLANQLDLQESGVDKSPASMAIWNEYLSLYSLVNHFQAEMLYVLDRRDFCTYQTISRLSQLRSFVLGSKLLSATYDLITIQYHSACLIKTLGKLPQVPFLIKDVVDIYLKGADKTMPDLNMSQEENKLDNVQRRAAGHEEEFEFNAEEAIGRNGPLSTVVTLFISLPFSFDAQLAAKAFKDSCRNFLIELEDRWQTMEMMGKMLSTDENGIERFNNYVIRILAPTRYADACSQLSAIS